MRSRYTAYFQRNEPYLLATWHASTRPESIAFDAKLKWTGLTVVATQDLASDRTRVEFIARYRIGTTHGHLHERSRFVREDNHWLYVDGEILD
jgi:SEC-C motif domain protein